ncbi:DUF6344 domain-containing protein [Streptomyces yaanensis]|uniref:DUF6344 domain-containing protein n=1 Tax=Streptomyces yaanensis TaxID=1142239 RepID=A0ABV7SCU9_9ACTN|nr:DUF6344 domain-containing protein [Streptomyces sp. CGMCC 4.7035]WNB96589.1 DUF6344 domain-containing protein [Streptomyces sp. CGMCC 4.7035]
MARNKVMKLWTAIVTAFLALCTALGFVTTTAAAAVPQPQPARNSCAHVTLPRPTHCRWNRYRSLPPTMKQRIKAEAHGASPTCRHRPRRDTIAAGPLIPSTLRTFAEPVAPVWQTARLQC